MIRFAALALGLSAVVGCGSAPRLGPNDLLVIASDTFQSSVADPQPAWNPADDRIVARAKGGFTIFEPGGSKAGVFESVERRETHYPCWLNATQFAFGPARNVIQGDDGTVAPSSDGLTVVTLVGRDAKRDILYASGFRPRLSADRRVVAQIANRIVYIDSKARLEEFGEGFNPVPAPPGLSRHAIAWQETPVLSPDHWTGKPVRGALVIRWSDDASTVVPNAIEAVWAADGSVLATRLNADPPRGKPWWTAGTDAIRIAGPGAAPQVILAGGRLPHPHPTEPIAAAVAADGGVVAVGFDGKGLLKIAAEGDQPQWNHDGSKLCVVVPRPARASTDLVVWRIAPKAR